MHHRLSQALRVIAVALTLHTSHFTLHTSAQRPPAQPNAAEIQKLNVLGSVLYIVAHPDDENTKLIAWLANGKKVRTGNLSLTRGDGGQNLIGPELGDALGIIRTQELMEARRIDGGEQFFTRAVDFGFSKNAAESFEKWGKQEVLSDVVRVIRTFRPDVIITRFAPDRSAGHGHHEASAILAEEAFDLAGDPKAFPEQLEQGLEVWQPRRLFFNGSTWWKKDLADIAKSDPDWFSVDVGGYDPLLGLSYTEIAGRSRSMHKSQGFGAAETRGESLEYLKLIKGDMPANRDPFDRMTERPGRKVLPTPPGFGPIQISANDSFSATDLVNDFVPTEPEGSLYALLRAFRDPTYAFQRRLREPALNELAWSTIGGTAELICSSPYVPLGSMDSLELSIMVRRPCELKPSSNGAPFGKPQSSMLISLEPLAPNTPLRKKVAVSNYDGLSIDQPYWLERPHGNLHVISEPSLIGTSVGSNALDSRLSWSAWGKGSFTAPVRAITRWVDRVAGERIRPVYVTPVASVIPKSDVLIATGGPQTITVEVEALMDSLTGQLNVTLPAGWGTTKDLKLVDIAKRNDRQSFTFQLIPSENAKAGPVKFEFSGPKGKADRTLHEIDYPHIMPQVYYTPAEVKLVPLEVTTTAKRVGYVKGAGDDVPQAMEQLGVVVEFIEPSAAKLEELKKYDAIVTGIRAYNATKGMKELHPLLLQYVEQGGTLVVQYNTTPRFFSGASDFQIDPATLGPHVTVEEAPPTFLDPKHPLLNTPNTITAADFEGWVQERGLYFASDFGTNYTPLIAWNDPGEEPLNGALIVTDHGKGRFVYTGISFFRQLPAGVGGAYRLWANMISPRTVK